MTDLERELKLVIDIVRDLYRLWDQHEYNTPHTWGLRGELERHANNLWRRIYNQQAPAFFEMVEHADKTLV